MAKEQVDRWVSLVILANGNWSLVYPYVAELRVGSVKCHVRQPVGGFICLLFSFVLLSFLQLHKHNG